MLSIKGLQCILLKIKSTAGTSCSVGTTSTAGCIETTVARNATAESHRTTTRPAVEAASICTTSTSTIAAATAASLLQRSYHSLYGISTWSWIIHKQFELSYCWNHLVTTATATAVVLIKFHRISTSSSVLILAACIEHSAAAAILDSCR